MISLPIEIKAVIAYLITQGLKSLSAIFGGDISGKWSAVVAAVVSAVLLFLEAILGLVPEDYVEIVNGFLAFLVVVLSSYGVHYTYKNL